MGGVGPRNKDCGKVLGEEADGTEKHKLNTRAQKGSRFILLLFSQLSRVRVAAQVRLEVARNITLSSSRTRKNPAL